MASRLRPVALKVAHPLSHVAVCGREFANQKALQGYVESNNLVYLWEGGRAFAMRFNQLSPKQRELVNVKTRRGMTKALLFPKAILRAEFAADTPLREALAIKRKRLQALRAKRAANRRL